LYAVLYLLLSYFLGNFLTAFFLIKWKNGKDIRTEGSKNPGARNIGRLYGKSMFVLVFIGDALKGGVAVWGASFLSSSPNFILLAYFAVVIGHIYPILLKGKGGKGVSTFIGGLIAFDARLIVVLIVAFCIFYLIKKSFTFAGITAMVFLPFTLYFFHFSFLAILLFLSIVIMIVLAHLDNLRQRSRKA